MVGSVEVPLLLKAADSIFGWFGLLRNGVAVGQLTMTTNAEKFENYVDMQSNQTEPLPTP